MKVEYIVESDTYSCWVEWHDKVDSWVQGLGWLETVGTLADMPVCISTMFEEINGHIVLFWHPTSTVVDYRQIEAWFQKNYPELWLHDRPGAHCDRMNFGHCLTHLEKL